MLLVGLTGSIGMGKSTTAQMFADLGVPVHDADKTVHGLYRQPDFVAQIEETFPGTTKNAEVDRKALGEIVFSNPDAIKALEMLVHPRVRDAEIEFVRLNRLNRMPYCITDIPLLFETGQSDRFDAIIVVTASQQTQRSRVLARPGMTEQKFLAIQAKQMPDEQKRARATYIINTDDGMQAARDQVSSIHNTLCKRASEPQQ